MSNKYELMTNDDFGFYLAKAVEKAVCNEKKEFSIDSLMLIPGIYEVLREEFNNDALELWEKDQEEDE